MSDWTLGSVKDRNMDVVAMCQVGSCRFMAVFNLDQLIESCGRDFRIDDIPPLPCQVCGVEPMKISLAMGEPPEEGEQ